MEKIFAELGSRIWNTPKTPTTSNTSPAEGDENEPDDWDKRIFSTGCAAERTQLNDCYFEKKDWRACQSEMNVFRECWKRHGNDQRTGTKNV